MNYQPLVKGTFLRLIHTCSLLGTKIVKSSHFPSNFCHPSHLVLQCPALSEWPSANHCRLIFHASSLEWQRPYAVRHFVWSILPPLNLLVNKLITANRNSWFVLSNTFEKLLKRQIKNWATTNSFDCIKIHPLLAKSRI